MNYFSRVDHGTLDQGASSLKSNRLSSAINSKSRIKGITCCCCYFFCSIFYVILFYFLSVISSSHIQKGRIKLLIVNIELRLMK